MRKNRDIDEELINQKRTIFKLTVNIIEGRILHEDERLGSSLLEALLVGVARNLEHVTPMDNVILRQKFEELRSDHSLSSEFLSGGVAKKEKVEARVNASIRIFGA